MTGLLGVREDASANHRSALEPVQPVSGFPVPELP